MKKNIFLVLLIILVLTGCSVKKEGNISNKQENIPLESEEIEEEEVFNQYVIDIVFDPQERTLIGKQRIIYTNSENKELSNIYLHLYPNAFKSKDTLPFLFDDYMRAYPQGFIEGYIDINDVKINDQTIKYKIIGNGDTILEVTPNKTIKRRETISIELKYFIKIPPARERFGYGDDIFNFGNWYPVMAVYDNSGWNLDSYLPIGDPFYSDSSDYRVSILAPKDFIVATTGEVIGKEEKEDSIQWTIEAKKVRDFAWVASSRFEVEERKVGETTIKAYFLKDGMATKEIKSKVISFAMDSIKIFNKVFGQYPYPQYSIVQTNFPSGMEYPQIVFIGKEFYNREYISYLESILVHETAHQWWYNVVGNDQIDEAWLDESLSSYSEVIYIEEVYGEREGKDYHRYENEEKYSYYKEELEDEAVLKTLNEFEGWDDYSLLVYTKGAIFLDDLRLKYGDEVFFKILQTYYNRHKFKIASTKDFLQICEEITGDELDEYFEKWLK